MSMTAPNARAPMPASAPDPHGAPTDTPKDRGAPDPPRTYDGYAWLLAWGVLIAVLTLANRTRLGHTTIYYLLCLLLFFVLVSNYRFIGQALAPFSSLPQPE